MEQAREVMDRLTAAITGKDKEMQAACYAADAVVVTPDLGEISGREAISDYLSQFGEAFPDLGYESVQKYEAGNVARAFSRVRTRGRCPCRPARACLPRAKA